MAPKLLRKTAGRPWEVFTRLAESAWNARHLSCSGRSEVQGMLKYYDKDSGRTRFKQRYVWAAWGFIAGTVIGVLVAHL
jgi:hypothetical protein